MIQMWNLYLDRAVFYIRTGVRRMAKAVGWYYDLKDHIITTEGRLVHLAAQFFDINQRISQNHQSLPLTFCTQRSYSPPTRCPA